MQKEDDGGWNGTRVRHVDGREGVVSGSYEGFLHRGLTLTANGERLGYIQLNSDGSASGDAGWRWLCSSYSEGPAWLPLGDHNGDLERILVADQEDLDAQLAANVPHP